MAVKNIVPCFQVIIKQNAHIFQRITAKHLVSHVWSDLGSVVIF